MQTSDRVKGVMFGSVLTAVLMVTIYILSNGTVAATFTNINIVVNGQHIQTESPPAILNDRTYLPITDMAHALGLSIHWDGITNTVYLETLSTGGSDTVTPPPTQQASSITVPANITPRPPARQGGPTNTAISSQTAVELARDHLVSIGVTDARFNYVYMDIENGVWVWSVEFDGQGRSYEFYVDVNTGAFIQAPSGGTSSPNPSPAQRGGTLPQTSPSASTPPGGHNHQQGNRPSNPAISLERAIEIAYADLAARGLTGTFRNHSGMDFERGQWVWELVFSVQGGRLPLVEYYINVDTGAIVKFEWDD